MKKTGQSSSVNNQFWWEITDIMWFSMNSKAELLDLHYPCDDQGAVKKEIMIIW